MKHVSKQIVYFALCGMLLTGLLGGISTSEASPLQLNNVYQNEPLQMDEHHDERRGHHRHHNNDNNDGGNNLVDGIVVGAIIGGIIANN